MSNSGKIVTIHCAFTLEDGTPIDDTRNRNEPLMFVCEEGASCPGIISAVEQMEIGQTVDVLLEPMDAFGEYSEDYIDHVPVSQIPNGSHLPIGQYIYLEEDGTVYPAMVVSVENDIATLDANHPMAGKTLRFSIELLNVEDAPSPEQ